MADASKAVDAMVAVKSALASAGLIKTPTVFITGEVDGAVRAELEKTVTALNCSLVQSDADATYIVHGPARLARSGPPLRRVASVGTTHSEVHWVGRPDSHNGVVPLGELGALAPASGPPSSGDGPWAVCAQWLSDSAAYNELMDPADYTHSDKLSRMSDAEFLGAVAGYDLGDASGKRKREESAESAAKRAAGALRGRPDPEPQPRVTQVEDTHPEATRERPPELKPPRNPEITIIPSAAEAAEDMADVEVCVHPTHS